MLNKTVLITGANGFIGQALLKSLSQDGYSVRGTVRSESALKTLSEFVAKHQLENVSLFNLGDLTEHTDWSASLAQVDTIVHCAARAHVLQETSDDPLKLFRQINCQSTERLVQQAQIHHVKRIVFISSIGVLGNTSQNTPFTDKSPTNPLLPYAQSKLEAEHTLFKYSKHIETVIIRPPLVYGPGVKGNFKKLLDLIDKGLPLPLGNIKNKRQFIGINNLVDFISLCIASPEAANHTFVVADKESVSTTELIQLIAKLKNKKIRLIPIPQQLVKRCLSFIGKEKIADQLLNNLEVQGTQAYKLLEWTPPFSMVEQMRPMVHSGVDLDQ